MTRIGETCCPACGVQVPMWRIAVQADYDRLICRNCKASLQRVSPVSRSLRQFALFTFLGLQLIRYTPWLSMCIPVLLVTGLALVKREALSAHLKLSDPWRLRP